MSALFAGAVAFPTGAAGAPNPWIGAAFVAAWAAILAISLLVRRAEAGPD